VRGLRELKEVYIDKRFNIDDRGSGFERGEGTKIKWKLGRVNKQSLTAGKRETED